MNLRRMIAVVVALILAAFFAFVGWNKAFAPLADLARYHAWTIYIPEALGRAIGWSEMALAVGLAASVIPGLRRLSILSALVLILNQIVAAAVHLAQNESSALPQNAVLIVLLGIHALLLRQPGMSKNQKETV